MLQNVRKGGEVMSKAPVKLTQQPDATLQISLSVFSDRTSLFFFFFYQSQKVKVRGWELRAVNQDVNSLPGLTAPLGSGLRAMC